MTSRRYHAFGNRPAFTRVENENALQSQMWVSTVDEESKERNQLAIPPRLNLIWSYLEHTQVTRRINMSDRSLTTMTPRNVEDFDIWVFEARDLVVSVVQIQAPWSATVENYQLDEPSD